MMAQSSPVSSQVSSLPALVSPTVGQNIPVINWDEQEVESLLAQLVGMIPPSNQTHLKARVNLFVGRQEPLAMPVDVIFELSQLRGFERISGTVASYNEHFPQPPKSVQVPQDE